MVGLQGIAQGWRARELPLAARRYSHPGSQYQSPAGVDIEGRQSPFDGVLAVQIDGGHGAVT